MMFPAFRRTILEWYEKNGRHSLPWRHTTDPYKILVSEIMLQQTPVDRVCEKYVSFLRLFPTVQKCATTTTPTLLRAWSGLGYNHRALNLRKAAQMLLRDSEGSFPQNPKEIEKLPGVGSYTARAVSVFAFNRPEVVLETNIRRVFIHFFFPKKETVSDDDLLPVIKKALYRKDPRMWYGALMDYGACALKEVPNPNRKSTHYSRQSRFEGSPRQARAHIVRFLLARGTKRTTSRVLLSSFKKNPHLLPYCQIEKLTTLLASLQKEGFLKKQNSSWRIA